ncbi:ATP-binding cassette domain-containing protein [Sphingomonas qomolangmaensis]|uniref:ATP-binding cassette domain-containing protein n=1 Tax=Sphingomonas qomolangmaensis TaxID=2918765 RepID=A0ABY5L3S9_9SPHN|nr:ATP-binding cassette domain-containing protein [Sphingomonas qomolangmaensis]UUL81609.1 ATP-binding cassette domain-containing protein [Sphingomonas qomolangmaensis]
MPDVSGPAVAFEGVTKTYPGGVVAVRGVDLAIAGGSFVALVGTSGSGKSTLLKTVNRLVDPSSGRVTIDGAPVAAGAAHSLRRRIGYVFQNVGLFPHLSVGENIAIGLRIGGTASSTVDARLAELLSLVDLPADIAARAPDALSGGQRQRVGVARALATEPKLLLMDEPFGALDPVTRSDLGKAIRALHDRLGLTTILVTHDMAEAMLLADRVLVMADGAIAADASPADLMAGRAGPAADALVAVPREQAHALAALEREA